MHVILRIMDESKNKTNVFSETDILLSSNSNLFFGDIIFLMHWMPMVLKKYFLMIWDLEKQTNVQVKQCRP